MAENNELEKTLWAAADKLRSNMDAAEYKHIVLGLIFLKYISDAFYDLHGNLKPAKASLKEPTPKTPTNIWPITSSLCRKKRWQYLQDRAKQPEIGKWLDEAMDAIEKINPSLKGVLPKIYADPELNKQRLGELIDLIGTIGFNQAGHKSQDLLGRVYEYFLGQFADAEGKKGGQFYTPASIVKLLVAMLEPYAGRVYDGCCGSGGMFVQSERFVEEHQGNIKDLSIFGQESNPTTLRLAKMNLAIRGIDAKLELGDTFLNDKHKDLKADYILANPPFNVSDWSGEQLRDDIRWQYGPPPVGNANYAWLQHYIHKLSPTGTAGIVLANGSMNSNTGGEGDIRRKMIEAGLVDCMVALPAQLFYNTMIPACLWFLARNKANHKFRDRSNEILFIDARNLGVMISRRNRELTDDDIARIANTYHAWRNKPASASTSSAVALPEPVEGNYQDIPGFCKAATLDEVRANNYVLMPGRYVGTEEAADDGIPFEEKMTILTEKLAEQFARGAALETTIRENLRGLAMSSSRWLRQAQPTTSRRLSLSKAALPSTSSGSAGEIKMPYMYILECADGSYYTGSTWNLEKRLWEHQNGLGANHTQKRLPVKLVYCEPYDRVEDAYRREKQIQGWSRRKKQALIEGNTQNLIEFSKNYTQYGRPEERLASAALLQGSANDTPPPELVEGGGPTESHYSRELEGDWL